MSCIFNSKWLNGRAGRSPSFQTPGTPLDRLEGANKTDTQVLASPIEQVLSSIWEALRTPLGVDSYPRIPHKTHGYSGTPSSST